MVDDFFRFLAANLPSVDEGDRMRWKLMSNEDNEDFNIRSFDHKLCGSFFFFSLKGIWKVKALRCRGFDFVDWCIMYRLWGDSSLFVATFVGRLIVCRVLSLEILGFHGFSQDQLQISFLVGGIGWGSTYLTFGI